MVALTGTLTVAFNFLRSLTPEAKEQARQEMRDMHRANISLAIQKTMEYLEPDKPKRDAKEEFHRRSNAEYIARGQSCFHRQEAKKTTKPEPI